MSFLDRLGGAETKPCRPFPRHLLTPSAWLDLLRENATTELLALWADTATVHALLRDGDNFGLVSVAVVAGKYPALSPFRPAASWFERMIGDLWGHHAEDGRDPRPWLDHGTWAQRAPLSPKPAPREAPPGEMALLAAEGKDLHQVAVGPVHAGIIEPGHFRFHCAGETVARLEIRLGYTHKGTLSLMRGKTPRAAARFAGRLSGDSTVGHALAFARAAEAACGTPAPPRADVLRAVMAEIERIANHVADIGALGNDTAFALLPARTGLHREAFLGAAAAAFGHRLMMDSIIPGGVAVDISAGGRDAILRAISALAEEMPQLVRIYEDTASLVDRMVGTGRVSAGLVDAFAAGGFVGRASGRALDLRVQPGYPPYDTLTFTVPTRREGDVDARIRVRLAEIEQSMALLRALLDALPPGPIAVPPPMASGEGIGWAEGFRGDIWHWLRLDGGLIASVFMRDPSWLQWPLLEAAIEGNIIADFPLCNKSFNCSYSGVDL